MSKSKFKKISCKCTRCNKPFSAFEKIDLCKECREKEKLQNLGVRPRMIRNEKDKLDALLDKVRAHQNREKSSDHRG